MTHVLDFLLSSLLLYKYVTLFIVLALSSLAIPLPANTLLIAVGALSLQGYMGFWTSLCVGIIADITGDLVMYGLTLKWGNKVLHWFRLSRTEYLTKLEQYIKTYTGITVFFTRFLTTFGPLVNFLAAVSDVSFAKFMIFDIMGNALNVFAMLFIGFILGNEWQEVSGILSTVGGVAIVIFVLVVVLVLYRTNKRKN